MREKVALFHCEARRLDVEVPAGGICWSTATSLEDRSERVATIETARIKERGDHPIKRLAGVLDLGGGQYVCQVTNADPEDAAPSFHKSVDQAGMAIRCE